MSVTLLETDYATLQYHPESKIVHHTFHRYIYGDQLRSVLLKGMECFLQQGANKWLSDDQKNSAIPQTDIDWSMAHWVPEMIEAGWRYWAIVLPANAVGKQNMTRIIDSYSNLGLITEVFNDVDEAFQWLEGQ